MTIIKWNVFILTPGILHKTMVPSKQTAESLHIACMHTISTLVYLGLYFLFSKDAPPNVVSVLSCTN